MTTPPPGLFARLLERLARPRAFALIAALAVLVTLPTLAVGLYSDDYTQLARLERSHPMLAGSSPFDLYRFVANAAERDRLVHDGPLPWFAHPALHLHFFRPLTSALIALDHLVWGRVAAGYHLTNVALYGALVLVAGAFFRAVTGAPRAGAGAVTAALAALCYALDVGHVQAVGWIAARHIVVAGIPAVLALTAHVLWVQGRLRAGAWLAPLGVVVALLASEAGLAAVVYWLAFDALGPAPPAASSARARLGRSVPVLLLGAAYAGFYKSFGYGTRGSGAYLDPATEPLAFAAALPVRVPALLGDLLLNVPSELSAMLSPAPVAVVGVLAVALVAFLYRAALPAVPAEERAALRWLVPGAFGALLLTAGGFPGGRLILLPGLASAYLLAVVFHRGAQRAAPSLGVRVGRGLLAVHLVLAPLLFTGNALALADVARKAREVTARAEIDPGAIRLVIVAASDPAAAFFAATVAVLEEPQRAGTWTVLANDKHDHRVTRAGPRGLRIEVLGGRMFDGAFERVMRAPDPPVAVGDSVAVAGATITVAAVDRGAPTAIDVVFDRAADDPGLQLVVWRGGRLARFHPPAVGESVIVPWEPGPFGLF
jgi:hypothetical protein